MIDLLNLLQTYGVPLVLLAWFMFRLEGILKRNTQTISNNTVAVNKISQLIEYRMK